MAGYPLLLMNVRHGMTEAERERKKNRGPTIRGDTRLVSFIATVWLCTSFVHAGPRSSLRFFFWRTFSLQSYNFFVIVLFFYFGGRRCRRRLQFISNKN